MNKHEIHTHSSALRSSQSRSGIPKFISITAHLKNNNSIAPLFPVTYLDQLVSIYYMNRKIK